MANYLQWKYIMYTFFINSAVMINAQHIPGVFQKNVFPKILQPISFINSSVKLLLLDGRSLSHDPL